MFKQATHITSDVFAYGSEAPNCFDRRRYLATIILATAEIEIILNKDRRMNRAGGGWRTLSIKLLREAAYKGPAGPPLARARRILKRGGIHRVHQLTHHGTNSRVGANIMTRSGIVGVYDQPTNL